MISKSKAVLAVKSLAVVAVVAGVATAGFDIQEPKAAASAPSGQCGLSLSRNFSGFNTYMQGSTDVGTSLLGVINFDTGTGTANLTSINNFGQNNAVNVERNLTATVVTAAAGPSTYKVTLTVTADNETSQIPYYFTSTNSGNTFLVKSVVTADQKTGAWMGVCQAL